jgi:hypothetical protein
MQIGKVGGDIDLRYIIAGELTRDFAILSTGRPLLDEPGGNTLYAASGLAIWEKESVTGLLARVGEDYPQEWINTFSRRGFDTRGIRVLPEAIDLRSFYVYTNLTTRLKEDPVSHFSRLGLSYPRALVGYRLPGNHTNSRTQLSSASLRQGDIVPDYLDATSGHLCPLDYMTHSVMPAVLRQAGFSILTLDPAAGYMNPIYWNDIPSLLVGLTAFLPSEEEARALFLGRSTDLYEISEALAAYGCEMVVIKRGENGQHIYDSTTKTHWEVPAYPARLVDLTGAGDAFCGGFLAGLRQTYDPLRAVLYGNISASITIEGSGPFFVLDALPGLAEARLNALTQSVRKV